MIKVSVIVTDVTGETLSAVAAGHTRVVARSALHIPAVIPELFRFAGTGLGEFREIVARIVGDTRAFSALIRAVSAFTFDAGVVALLTSIL